MHVGRVLIYTYSFQDEEIWAEREKVDEILLDALERKILENGEASRKVIASNSEKIAVQITCAEYISVLERSYGWDFVFLIFSNYRHNHLIIATSCRCCFKAVESFGTTSSGMVSKRVVGYPILF